MHCCPCCAGAGVNVAGLAEARARATRGRFASRLHASDFLVAAAAARSSSSSLPSTTPTTAAPLPFDPLRIGSRSSLRSRRGFPVAAATLGDDAGAPSTAAKQAVPRQFSSLDSEYWETEDGSGGSGGASGSLSASTSTPSTPSSPPSTLPITSGTSSSPSDNYCIIESRESVKDFAALELGAITEAIRSRRNRIYFLMEEVRRLRIQERLKSGAFTPPGRAAEAKSASGSSSSSQSDQSEVADERFPSAIPFFPAVTGLTLKTYGRAYAALVTAIILFGGLAAPLLEVKLGLGGHSYADLIESARLPAQLAAVDPIVASFCGGAVGVLTTLLIVENNNAALVAANRCVYCGGTGYVACGACAGAGVVPAEDAQPQLQPEPALAMSNGISSSSTVTCSACSGTGKVACIACLCTGKKVARETDQRLDPFS